MRAKTKVIRGFQMGHRFFETGSEAEFDIERAQRLVGEGLVEIIQENKAPEPVETAFEDVPVQPTKSRRKKK